MKSKPPPRRTGPGRPAIDPRQRRRQASYSLHPDTAAWIAAEAAKLGISCGRFLDRLAQRAKPG